MSEFSGILVIDKPGGITSHSVVSRARRILGMRRIGHTGTLDPMATGVLPILTGRATRASDYIINDSKSYTAGMKFGVETDTQDVTGRVVRAEAPSFGYNDLMAALEVFKGDIVQVPPMYSAIKREGQPLYKLARQGIEVDRPPRDITIYRIELLSFDSLSYEAVIHVGCSKGVYIRTLIAEIGRRLGCGAAMSGLRRTRTGPFSIENAITLETLETLAESGRLAEAMIPVDKLFDSHAAVTLSAADAVRLKNGAAIRRQSVNGKVRVYDPDGEFLAIGQASERGLEIEKTFFDPLDRKDK